MLTSLFIVRITSGTVENWGGGKKQREKKRMWKSSERIIEDGNKIRKGWEDQRGESDI